MSDGNDRRIINKGVAYGDEVETEAEGLHKVGIEGSSGMEWIGQQDGCCGNETGMQTEPVGLEQTPSGSVGRRWRWRLKLWRYLWSCRVTCYGLCEGPDVPKRDRLGKDFRLAGLGQIFLSFFI